MVCGYVSVPSKHKYLKFNNLAKSFKRHQKYCWFFSTNNTV